MASQRKARKRKRNVLSQSLYIPSIIPSSAIFLRLQQLGYYDGIITRQTRCLPMALSANIPALPLIKPRPLDAYQGVALPDIGLVSCLVGALTSMNRSFYLLVIIILITQCRGTSWVGHVLAI